jgi:hypothetical protein
MPVRDYDFMKKLKHVARFEQWKMLSESGVVIDGPTVLCIYASQQDVSP